MAISNINISQNNVYNGSNLLPIHSDLTFLVDATYSGDVPNVILVDIIHDSEVLSTYRLIPYRDSLSTVRTFAFKAGVIKGLMNDFNDEYQLNETLVYINDMTKVFTLKFYDPDDSEINTQFDYAFVHGANQFGQNPNKDDVFNNEHDTYLCPTDSFCYVYFYNDNESNVITVGDSTLDTEYALDFDGSIFTDYEGTPFTINVQI